MDEQQRPAALRLLHALQHPQERRWACPGCGEIIAGPFDQCWSCGALAP
jgi:rubrerythrin